MQHIESLGQNTIRELELQKDAIVQPASLFTQFEKKNFKQQSW